ncbi:MAG TPA: cobyrinate a,c-diamide synthase [Anaeromyxobacteraceae bacterium]|nr:cobyrinate a,c-diamide synthase [Anaeromyxobacteraceae bacterium]
MDAPRPAIPRVVVAGLAGDTGKSLVAMGVIRALTDRGRRVAPFKNGPDFIDAAWLGAAAGAPGRNLDTWLMAPPVLIGSLRRAAGGADLAVIEGKRGVLDGVDARGTHSTARLAKLLGAPVVLVVNAAKVTRTVAALVVGCRVLDPDLPLVGVILNRVGNGRQENLIRRALIAEAGVPVLGAIPPLEGRPLPSRHLGLVCASEHPAREATLEALGETVAKYVDLESICAVSDEATDLPEEDGPRLPRAARPLVRVGVLRDAAFSFYYPENLEALEAAGAELVPISPLADRELPAIDALYAGGGFPEEHAEALASNESLRRQLAAALAAGLPAWAECGGLMYLARALVRGGHAYPMVGALPVVVEHTDRPQGHGYAAATVDRANPFFPVGTRLLGHEFHHSRIAGSFGDDTVLSVERGSGLGRGRDGLIAGNTVATYLHLHALGTPRWAPSLVQAALGRRARGAAARPAAFAGAHP